MANFVHHGNEVKVVMDGIELDLVQTVRGSDNYGHEPASGVGDIHIKEHVPSLARHTVTLSAFALRKDRAITLGIIQENGNAALRGKAFTIEVFDRTGALIRKWTQCVNDSGDVTVTAHRIIVKDATFLATDAAGVYAVS